VNFFLLCCPVCEKSSVKRGDIILSRMPVIRRRVKCNSCDSILELALPYWYLLIDSYLFKVPAFLVFVMACVFVNIDIKISFALFGVSIFALTLGAFFASFFWGKHGVTY